MFEYKIWCLIAGEEPNYGLTGEGFMPVTEHFDEEYAGAEFHETRTLLADGGDRFGVSTITFDTIEELMWMGNQGVSDNQKYESAKQYVS